MPSKLGPEDLRKVEEYLNAPQHQVERKPFRPLLLMIMLILVVVTLGGLSRLLSTLVH